MITNREEIIDRAFGVFVRMNYEKASIITLARACGLTKTGIVYYFPHKLDLFMAVVEGGNLAASKIRNLECPSYEICLIDYGCGKFNRKIHIMEQYP